VHRVADIATAVVVVAGILVLTRPGSQGAKVIQAIGGTFTSALAVATGATPKGFQRAR
jgi:hypothetical protein